MKKTVVLLAGLAALALLSMAIFGAGRSDVADAACRGDKAAVADIDSAEGRRERAAAGWRDGAALGCVSRR